VAFHRLRDGVRDAVDLCSLIPGYLRASDVVELVDDFLGVCPALSESEMTLPRASVKLCVKPPDLPTRQKTSRGPLPSASLMVTKRSP